MCNAEYVAPMGYLLQRREDLDKKWKELNMATNLDSFAEPETIDLPSHTVTVTDVANVDFIGSSGFMLGANQVGSRDIFFLFVH